MGEHRCHHGPCRKRTMPMHAFCAEHWRRLSVDRQAQIWRHYKKGQESSKSGVSLLWLSAMREAVADLFEQDGQHEAAAKSRALAGRFRDRVNHG